MFDEFKNAYVLPEDCFIAISDERVVPLKKLITGFLRQENFEQRMIAIATALTAPSSLLLTDEERVAAEDIAILSEEDE